MTNADAVHLARIVVGVVREYVTRRVDLIAQETRSAWVVLKDELAIHRERLAVAEVRQLVPGPAGAPGRDGVNGVGFDDLVLEQVDETTVILKAIRGEIVKVIGSVTFPVAKFKGPYEDGCGYTPGNLVRYKRAIWHCHKATALAPDGVTYDASGAPAGPQGKDYWTLLLADGKRGNDGKDGAPGPSGPRGPGWDEEFNAKRRK